jgi:hypothetical protein
VTDPRPRLKAGTQQVLHKWLMTFSLDSVIRLPAGTPTRVREDFHLVEFHSKCWGKDLNQIRKPLPDLVPPVVSDKNGKAGEKSLEVREGKTQGRTRTENDEDGDVVDGDKKGKAKEENVEKGEGRARTDNDNDVESMDEDWSELDDITPDTCVFDINVRRVSLRPILIRADYIRMFDVVSNYFSKPMYVDRAKYAIVTGQPGIGESPNYQ